MHMNCRWRKHLDQTNRQYMERKEVSSGQNRVPGLRRAGRWSNRQANRPSKVQTQIPTCPTARILHSSSSVERKIWKVRCPAREWTQQLCPGWPGVEPCLHRVCDKMQQDHRGFSFGGLSTHIATLGLEMDPEEKQHFLNLDREDKDRYQEETSEYIK